MSEQTKNQTRHPHGYGVEMKEIHTPSGVVKVTSGFASSISQKNAERSEGMERAREKLKHLLNTNKETAAKFVG